MRIYIVCFDIYCIVVACIVIKRHIFHRASLKIRLELCSKLLWKTRLQMLGNKLLQSITYNTRGECAYYLLCIVVQISEQFILNGGYMLLD